MKVLQGVLLVVAVSCASAQFENFFGGGFFNEGIFGDSAAGAQEATEGFDTAEATVDAAESANEARLTGVNLKQADNSKLRFGDNFFQNAQLGAKNENFGKLSALSDVKAQEVAADSTFTNFDINNDETGASSVALQYGKDSAFTNSDSLTGGQAADFQAGARLFDKNGFDVETKELQQVQAAEDVKSAQAVNAEANNLNALTGQERAEALDNRRARLNTGFDQRFGSQRGFLGSEALFGNRFFGGRRR